MKATTLVILFSTLLCIWGEDLGQKANEANHIYIRDEGNLKSIIGLWKSVRLFENSFNSTLTYTVATYTEGGTLFVSSGRGGADERKIDLICETNAKDATEQPHLLVTIAALKGPSATSKASVIDLSFIKSWRVSISKDRVHPEGATLIVSGDSVAGIYREETSLHLQGEVYTGRLYLLDLLAEGSLFLATYKDGKRVDRIDLGGERPTQKMVKEGKFSAGGVTFQRE